MLDFKPLTLNEIPLLRPYFVRQPSRICDSTIGGTFLWRDYFQTAYAEHGGTLFLRSRMPDTGEIFYSVPMDGDVPRAMHLLKEDCDLRGEPLVITTAAKEDLPVIWALWPSAVIRSIPNWADYLYNAADLCQLQGKHYGGQRNHISRFQREHDDWRFTPITPENLPEVQSFYRQFAARNEKDSATFAEDEKKVVEVLENYQLYGFLGGAVWADEQIVSMAMGEVQGDTLYVHIEKGNTDYRGAYQMIVQQFSQFACQDGVLYINREDDAGDEGLRTSKLSYHPCDLLEKYEVRIG